MVESDAIFDTETYTVSTWFKMDAAVYNIGLYGNRSWAGGPSKGLGASLLNQKPRGTIPSGDDWEDARSTVAANVGEWTMLTWVIDGTVPNAKLYMNGQLDSTWALDGPDSMFPFGTLRIGDTGGNGVQEAFIGMIDDMGIWNHALGPDEVAGIYANPVPEPSTIVLVCMGAWGFVVCAWRRRKRS